MPKRIINLLALFLLALVLSATLSACNFPWKKKPAAPAASSQAQEEIAATQYTKQLMRFSDEAERDAFLTGKEAASDFSLSGAASVGVDFPSAPEGERLENIPDIVKSDGRYAYIADQEGFKVVSIASGAEELLAKVELDQRASGLLVSGTKLAVFGPMADGQAFLDIYDLSVVQSPRLVRQLSFSGSFLTARLAGDYLYFLTVSPGQEIAGGKHPAISESGTPLGSDCSTGAACVATETYYFDIAYGRYGLLEATAIDLSGASQSLKRQEFLVDERFSAYIATSDVYLSHSDALDQVAWRQAIKGELFLTSLSAADQEKAAAIKAAADYVLSPAEKNYKLSLLVDSYLSSLSADERLVAEADIDNALQNKLNESASEESTQIYKFSLFSGSLSYRGSGIAAGRLLDSASLAAIDDKLYVGTISSAVGAVYYGNISVFAEDMSLLGSLARVPLGYPPVSARFFAGRAYLSSFGQGDPLYVFDTSDPSKIAASGAIKVPDYISVLRSLGNKGDLLAGLGQEKADALSSQAGDLKLTLYDFSDLSQPKEADSFVIGESGSDSAVLKNPAAFFYSDTAGALLLPAVLRSGQELSFAGALVFRLEDKRFSLLGKVDHTDGLPGIAESGEGFPSYDNTVKRSLIDGGRLLTFSSRALKLNGLADFSAAASVIFDGRQAVAPEVSASNPAAENIAPASSTTPALTDSSQETNIPTGEETLPEEIIPEETVPEEIISDDTATSSEVVAETPAETPVELPAASSTETIN